MPVSLELGGESGPEMPGGSREADGGAARYHNGPPSGDGCVQIAYLHDLNPGQVSHSWHVSMMGLVAHDAGGSQRLVSTAGPIMIGCDASGLAEGRNQAVKTFLDETPHEWLFFIDTDMGFKPDTVDRLVEAAHPELRPVVGGLCFMLKEMGPDGFGGRTYRPMPTLFGLAQDAKGQIGFGLKKNYTPNTLTQVAGTGGACLLIHRSVLQELRDAGNEDWFTEVRYPDGTKVSEDLSFCYRVGALGKRIFVHTGVETTHHKTIYVNALDYQQPEE